jgi:hypothetical protein
METSRPLKKQAGGAEIRFACCGELQIRNTGRQRAGNTRNVDRFVGNNASDSAIWRLLPQPSVIDRLHPRFVSRFRGTTRHPPPHTVLDPVARPHDNLPISSERAMQHREGNAQWPQP